MPRTLIIKFGAIGDVVMLIPAAHQLHLAGHDIDWVCGPAVLPILRLYPWINPLAVDDRKILKGGTAERLSAIAGLWRALGGRRYDICATLYYDARYRILALPVRAARKFQLSHEDREYRLLPGRHHTDEYARILLGLPDELRPVQLAPVPPETLPATPLARTTQPRVLLAPAGAKNMMADDALRRWPAESYVALTALLAGRSVEVVLIGGPDDAWVQPLFAALQVTDLIGKLSLIETLALMDAGDVVVTHDTGPLHLAGNDSCRHRDAVRPPPIRAAGCRSGRERSRCGAARASPAGRATTGRGFAACPRNDCIRQYTPAMVLDEVLRMLEQRARGVQAAPRVQVPERIS